MRTVLSLLLVVIVAVTLAVYGTAQTRTSKSLDIYVVDVEGGNATLFISPNGESVLIDTGNAGGTTGRDAGRILDAAKDAGLQ
jgi:competence protein ComEC